MLRLRADLAGDRRRFVLCVDRLLFVAAVLRPVALRRRERDAALFRAVLRFRVVALLRPVVEPVRDRAEPRFAVRLDFFRRDWPDSDIAIAIACFRLFTFLPDLPLLSSPSLYSRMTFLTLPRCRLVAIRASGWK